MNRSWSAYLRLVLLGLLLVCGGFACHRQGATSANLASKGFPNLPDATNVIAALDQKDYASAVSALAKLKESVSTEAQQQEYTILTGVVRDRITEALGSDPNAAEAMQALRVVIAGR